jgi:hypothetical protein
MTVFRNLMPPIAKPSPPPALSARRLARAARLLAAAMAAIPLIAAAQHHRAQPDAAAGQGGFEIRNGTIASGGGDIGAARYQLTGSFGEPVTGTVAAQGVELTAGFPATLNAPNQIIFIDGFEPSDEQP